MLQVYRAVLLHQYGTAILVFLAVLFINVFAIVFVVNRRFFHFFSRTQEEDSLTSIRSYKSGRENYPHLRLNPLTKSWADNVALIFTRCNGHAPRPIVRTEGKRTRPAS
jgi:hypothetical protein